jgi:uncharacterized membrane protein YdjX (TVP38/TMEM64 family)
MDARLVARQGHVGIKVVVALLLLVGLVCWFTMVDIDWTQCTPEALRTHIATWGVWAPVAYVVGYSLRVFLLVPASLMTITGFVLFGPWWGALYVTIGIMLCAILEFGLVRWLGRETVVRWLATFHWLNRIDQAIAGRGFFTVWVIRTVPNVPFDLQNISLGLSPVRWRDYVLATLIGPLPWLVVYAMVGEALADFRNFWKIILGFVAFLILVWAPWLWRKIKAERGQLDTPTT